MRSIHVALAAVASMFLMVLPSHIIAANILQLSAPLPDNYLIGSVRVSPDNGTILYTTQEIVWQNSGTVLSYRSRGIFSVPLQGGTAVQINRPAFAEAELSGNPFVISADGKNVYFTGMQDAPSITGLYRASIDGSSFATISLETDSGSSQLNSFQVLPDQSRVIYKRRWNGDLYSTELGTGASDVLNVPRQPDRGGSEWEDGVVASAATNDSERVVYETDSRELYSVRPDGSDKVLLASGGAHFSQISPDGQTVIFSRVRSTDQFNRHLTDTFSIPVDGGQEVMLHPPLPDWGTSHFFHITADGKYLLLNVVKDRLDEMEWYSLPTEGGDFIRLMRPLLPDEDVSPAVLTPDNKYIVMSLFAADDSGGLYKVALDGSESRKISLPISADSGLDDSILSHDGQRVFSLLRNSDGDANEIFISPLDGTEASRVEISLPRRASIDQFDVTANGEYIVYTADAAVPGQFEVFYVPVTGGASVRISPELGTLEQAHARLSVVNNWAVFSHGLNFHPQKIFAVQLPEPSAAATVMLAFSALMLSRNALIAATRCRSR